MTEKQLPKTDTITPMPKVNPPRIVMTKEGRLTVSRTILGQDSISQEKIYVRAFGTRPALVKYSLGRTVSSGVKFEFCRVDVGIEAPGYVEEVHELFDQAKRFVEDRLAQEMAEIDAAIQQQGDLPQ